ncbi:hypothetical protein PALB_34270 [Pseudoalteromonas luteoviolacea B = ATCC 29581]|nr:hypothetical protein PALB_34270 [Pseudoalteromonas luteoviolacea B = ATCC 29581]
MINYVDNPQKYIKVYKARPLKVTYYAYALLKSLNQKQL